MQILTIEFVFHLLLAFPLSLDSSWTLCQLSSHGFSFLGKTNLKEESEKLTSFSYNILIMLYCIAPLAYLPF